MCQQTVFWNWVDGGSKPRRAQFQNKNPELADRYLGEGRAAVYLMRPDQHVVARWDSFNEAEVKAAVNIATGRV